MLLFCIRLGVTIRLADTICLADDVRDFVGDAGNGLAPWSCVAEDRLREVGVASTPRCSCQSRPLIRGRQDVALTARQRIEGRFLGQWVAALSQFDDGEASGNGALLILIKIVMMNVIVILIVNVIGIVIRIGIGDHFYSFVSP